MNENFVDILTPLYRRFSNLADLTNEVRPAYLAHYTSLEVIEKIIQNTEIWFSNPLFMNDRQELRYGLFEGMKLINNLSENDAAITDAGGAENLLKITQAYQRYFEEFDIDYSFDVYVFCLSQYDWGDQPDGRLSMWRGYGADGQGAALVFNTNFITAVPNSPFLIGKVQYLSGDARQDVLRDIFLTCINKTSMLERNDAIFNWIGQNMFYLNLLDALLSKHSGFKEEEEWRVIYLPFLDKIKLMEGKFTYLRRGNIIEPKLKFRIEPLQIEHSPIWSFDSIVDRIVLGPTHASALAIRSVRRMFEHLGRPELAKKIWISEIPYRPLR